jgi:hypothetical protein
MAKTLAQPTIASVKIKRIIDESPDTSFIGEYTDDCNPWAIDRAQGEYVAILEASDDGYEMPRASREYRYFVPYAGGEKQGTENYQKYGKQDFERMESLERGNWYFIGIRAIAEIRLPQGDHAICQRIDSPGLWGIESDSDDGYIESVAREELAQLRDMLEQLNVSTDNWDELTAAALDDID